MERRPGAAGVTGRRAEATLRGSIVLLRLATSGDIAALVPIRAHPAVRRWWRGGADLEGAIAEDLAEPGSTAYVIEHEGRVVGWIQWSAEDEPDYRFATLDLYLDPSLHGRGIGADAVATVVGHLIAEHGHRRFEIDPAVANLAAIACYAKVGFRPVGIRRRSERGEDGTWHDVLLMDLLAEEVVGVPVSSGPRDRGA